jgi:peptidoglycan/xylan/chitin deacetylase (PgdA/CDA1 family)
MLFSPPAFVRHIMPSLVWNLGGADEVYLTFDDGPTPGVTEWVLETLGRYDARATFFCLGKNVEQHPETYAKILAAGHKTGNHTYSHQKGWRMSLQRYVEDVDFAAQLIHSDLFRPPYGRITPAQARVLSERYHLIMWDILSRDYSSLVSPRQCVKNVTRHVGAGSIVVFHDSWKSARRLKYALPRVLEYIYNKGLRCESITL